MVTHKENFLRIQLPQIILGLVALFHLMFTQSWLWLIATYVFILLVYVMGEGIFLHRYFSHKAFECRPGLAKFFAFITILGGFGTPIGYRAIHVMHHGYSDKPGDPHSPVNSIWNSIYKWWLKPVKLSVMSCKSLLAQPYYVWLAKNELRIWWISLIVFSLIDIELMLYTIGLGGLLCYVFGNIVTNTMAHKIGSRRFDTDDNSRNIWWLSWLTLQGSSVMQNNHHAHPSRFHDSWAWYEIDVGKWIIPLIATKINYTIKEKNV